VKYPAPPTYIEDFPAPALEEPGCLRQSLLLSPDGEGGWNVDGGHVKLALWMVLAAQGDNSVETKIEQAIAKARSADAAAGDWRRRWAANLAENPAIQAALEDSPDALYARAGLSLVEQIAMRAWSQLDDEGNPPSTREIARKLKEAESTIRTRLERAVTRLRGLRHVATVAA
jgi:hypothetical protein